MMKKIALVAIFGLLMICSCATVPNPVANREETNQKVDYRYLKGAKWHGSWVSHFNIRPIYTEIKIEGVETNKLVVDYAWSRIDLDSMKHMIYLCEIVSEENGLRFVLRDMPRIECTLKSSGDLECIWDDSSAGKYGSFFNTTLTRF